MKESAKAVLQDSNKKQRAQEYLQKGLLFEVGRLIHDTPVSSSNPSSGGKGAGKGKSKQKQIGQTARIPWSNLTPRPDSIFVDALANPVPIVPLSQVHSAATGVFLAGASEFESFLGITSNAPLAMLAPQTPKISATLQARQLKYSERMVALYNSNTGISTPKPCFLIQLGSAGFTVAFAETKPDVTFATPDPVVEVAVDVEIGQVDVLMQQEIDKNPRFAFKQIVQAAFSEHVVRETYAVHTRSSTLHGLIKVPAAQLANVLKRSGPDGIFAKEKWRTGAPSLPLALIHQSHLRAKDWDKAVKATTGLAGWLWYPSQFHWLQEPSFQCRWHCQCTHHTACLTFTLLTTLLWLQRLSTRFRVFRVARQLRLWPLVCVTGDGLPFQLKVGPLVLPTAFGLLALLMNPLGSSSACVTQRLPS